MYIYVDLGSAKIVDRSQLNKVGAKLPVVQGEMNVRVSGPLRRITRVVQ